MKANIVKNLKFRTSFLKSELFNKSHKFLLINLLNHSNNKNHNLKYFCNIKTNLIKFSKPQLKPQCFFTGRNRSVIRKFSLSRIAFRAFIRNGFISGFKKAVW
jgi:ribosomal protein S14